jgi:uncharacterized protein (TIGR02611 family)
VNSWFCQSAAHFSIAGRVISKSACNLTQVKRAVVFVAGIAVLLLGIVMLVAPGPGILTTALGLGILATEFIWARRLLKRFRRKGINIADRLLRLASSSLVVRRRDGGRQLTKSKLAKDKSGH